MSHSAAPALAPLRRHDAEVPRALQVASLVLATHKVLLPYIRNEHEVIEMLKDQNGAKTSEGIRCACMPPRARPHVV
jgi:hypothetical protein